MADAQRRWHPLSKFNTWASVDAALREGLRGLTGGSSLAQLLAEHRGVRNIHQLPTLTETLILEWLDEHRTRTGAWPTAESGVIPGSGGEKWSGIEQALIHGSRDLRPGSSIAKLLAVHRGGRNRKQLPPLTIPQVLGWADARFARNGDWPTSKSGPIEGAPGETWLAVDMALRKGRRRLTGGSSLAKLLATERNVRNASSLPKLTVASILAWMDAWHARKGQWPNSESGPIPEAAGETWAGVNSALKRGTRGLLVRCTLAQLLAAERGVRNKADPPRLSRKLILRWVIAHHHRTGEWPTKDSGTIHEALDETWAAVDAALAQGHRGLRPGSSLARLLAEYGKKRNLHAQPPLSRKKILAWADAHFAATGKWPNVKSGDVVGAPGERWDLIDNALRLGLRRLPGGSSLLKLLAKKRGVRNLLALPRLTEDEVRHWARLHRQRTGGLPKYNSGPIAEAPGETWAAVDYAIRYGRRGFPGGSSLAKLLAADGGEAMSS